MDKTSLRASRAVVDEFKGAVERRYGHTYGLLRKQMDQALLAWVKRLDEDLARPGGL